MRSDLVIRNGLVLTPDGGQEADVAISGGVIVGLGGGFDGQEDLDAAGAWVGSTAPAIRAGEADAIAGGSETTAPWTSPLAPVPKPGRTMTTPATTNAATRPRPSRRRARPPRWRSDSGRGRLASGSGYWQRGDGRGDGITAHGMADVQCVCSSA